MAIGVLAVLAASGTLQFADPVLWLNLKGEVLVDGQSVKPRMTPGASRFRGQNGMTYSFTGERGGILFPDLPNFRLTGSISVATWIYAKSYVNDGPGAQILFRGDDRGGLDPYDLVIQGDGTIVFGISDQNYQGMCVKAELPLNEWTHVTASFNARSGELLMYLNGEPVAKAKTSKRPMWDLDTNIAPGLGIGNVQNDQGPHNQPFNGMLADIRLYRDVVTPDAAGFDPIYLRGKVANPPLLAMKSRPKKVQ